MNSQNFWISTPAKILLGIMMAATALFIFKKGYSFGQWLQSL